MRILANIFITIIILSASLSAGQLSPDLSDRIESMSDTDFITVWIKLLDVGDANSFKATAQAASPSRAERHAFAINSLKRDHANAQQSLLDLLLSDGKSNGARNVKPHWIVNVIETDIPVAQLKALAARTDIDIIHPVPEITSIEPLDTRSTPPDLSASVTDNLTYINAPAAWAMGYTGQGRIICSFDTGVDGDHPYLYSTWKGHDGDSSAAWYDPSQEQAFPHVFPGCPTGSCYWHGTHVMGIMVGSNGTDTIGVAPDAKWISAGVIDLGGTSIIDAFEWAADPDGDPNTISDVPDVINHSWGVKYVDCQNLFFDLIDYTEALGIVNIFAAGNDGASGAQSIRNPANRALSNIDCFAVGNLYHSFNTIAATSSRGPSDCDGSSIKPNVVAPGTNITSANADATTTSRTGTSMAAPHVSGLVALLREKNPNATVDEIKTAILNSTNDLGFSLPDNTYGWGVIDCQAALNALSGTSSAPNIKVYAYDYAPLSAGDTAEAFLQLKNFGSSAANISATLAVTNPALTILNGSAFFGTIAQNAVVQGNAMIRVAVADTLTPGSILSENLIISGTGYTDTLSLFFLVEPPLERSFVTHDAGNIEFSVSNFGTYGFAGTSTAESFFPRGGAGFDFKSKGNDLYEAGLIVGIGYNQVSDGVRNGAGEPDGDFAVLPGGNIQFVTPRPLVAQQTYARFDDSRAENPIGLEFTQHTFAFDQADYANIIIMQYLVKNVSGGTLNNLYLGLYLDWDVIDYSFNCGGYDNTSQILWSARTGTPSAHSYRGVKVVDGTVASAFTADADSLVWYHNDAGFEEFEKFDFLIDGFTTATMYADSQMDLSQLLTVSLSLSPGQTDTVAFALMADSLFGDFTNLGTKATEAYLLGVTDVEDNNDDPVLPEKFALYQNYPNPFNPATVIRFDLPRASRFTLTIYNIAGQTVFEKKGFEKAGPVSIEWNADDQASGLYLYRVQAGPYDQSRKMILLK